MKIRKYFAADMRQALNLARQEQGPDVVILGNKKVLGGIELIAAEDYDETLFIEDELAKNINKINSVAKLQEHGTEENAKPAEAKPMAKINPPITDAVKDDNVLWSRDPSLD